VWGIQRKLNLSAAAMTSGSVTELGELLISVSFIDFQISDAFTRTFRSPEGVLGFDSGVGCRAFIDHTGARKRPWSI
jgi:hypothetical protein